MGRRQGSGCREAGSKCEAEVEPLAHLRGRDGFMTWRAAVLWAFALALSFGCATVWSGSPDVRSPPSPRTFVLPQSCDAETPCEPGYWVFRAPDCQYHGVSHPPGSIVLLESETTLQCRCRLVWLLTKRDTPPKAKVSCAWIDLDEAREEE